MRCLFLGLGGMILAFPKPILALSQGVVCVTIADLRADRTMAPLGASDKKELTQLLYGEPVEILETRGAWVRVQATEQPAFRFPQRWVGYPGWLPKSSIQWSPPAAIHPKVVIKKWLSVLEVPRKGLITRLPLGSRLFVLARNKHWSQIELPDGRTGWVASEGIANDGGVLSDLRGKILQTATLSIGDPYVWGGRSPYDATHRTRLSGVDCSGLVHLAYQVNGVIIPRDAIDQYRQARPIERQDLKPADLIFSAPLKDPKKIAHVMLYAGKGWVLEAPQTGMPVRKITFKEKTGVDLGTVESGQALKDRVVYFGRLVKD